MELEKPYVYSGVFTDRSETEHITASFTISKGGIEVSTDAGVFSDCIQVKWQTSVGAESGETEIEIMAPGVGTVKRWTSNLWRVQEGYEPAAFEADTEYHEAIDYGSSDPPFPSLRKLLGDGILSKILANDLYR